MVSGTLLTGAESRKLVIVWWGRQGKSADRTNPACAALLAL